MNILEKIVESKKREIERLHEQYDLKLLHFKLSESSMPRFYQDLAEARARGEHFFIAEFKRKSPSEGWINHDADLPAQVRAYAKAGAGAISVLTDESFFGGSRADLQLAAETLAKDQQPKTNRPLLLQKDFILDPIQIYLAKLHGADIILLIAAILEPEQLNFLKKTAESLGMGVLVEVHDTVELEKIRHLDFPVLGVNNRDLKTFRTALNRVNVVRSPSLSSTPPPTPPPNGRGDVEDTVAHVASPLPFGGGVGGGVDEREQLNHRFLIAESGIRDYCDFQAVRHADGFLIGTGLMGGGEVPTRFEGHFQSRGKLLFKACGIRTVEMLTELRRPTALSRRTADEFPDFLGLNFSPMSKRRTNVQTCEFLKVAGASNVVAVFYKNSESDIRDILEKYPFRAVQLYADDVSPEFVRSLKQRVLLAVRISESLTWSETLIQYVEPYAADVDFFILDGAMPGSGQRIGAAIPTDFPYPFLLAGGLHEGNLEAVLECENCIGVDIASGIETEGQVDLGKIRAIATRLSVMHPSLGHGAISE